MIERKGQPSPERSDYERAFRVLANVEQIGLGMGPNKGIWDELLGRVAGRMDGFVRDGVSCLSFKPPVKEPERDEEIYFDEHLSWITWHSIRPVNQVEAVFATVDFQTIKSDNLPFNLPFLIAKKASFTRWGVESLLISDLHSKNCLTWALVGITDQELANYGTPLGIEFLPPKQALSYIEIPD